MSAVMRSLFATGSLLGLWFVAMALEALSAPMWALGMIAGLLLANLIALMVWVHQATREHDVGDGDGGLPRPHPEVPNPGDDDPTWWTELEQYLAEHDRRGTAPAPSGAGREQTPAGRPA